MQQLYWVRISFITLFCTFFLVACDWGAKEETIAENYLYAVAKGDLDKAMGMIYLPPEILDNPSEHGEYIRNLSVMLSTMKEKFFDAHGGISSIQFPDKTYSPDKRQVSLQYIITLGNGSTRSGGIKLILINKTWRIRAR